MKFAKVRAMLRSWLFWKAYLGCVGLVVLTLTIVGGLIRTQVYQATLHDLQEELHVTNELLQPYVRSSLPQAGDDVQRSALCAMARQAGVRLTLIGPGGQVLVDSAHDPRRMPNHADRPEIQAAAVHGEGTATRPSETVGMELLYHAHAVRMADGTVGYLRLSKPAREIETRSASVRNTAMAATAMAGGLALIFGYFLTASVVKPLLALTRWVQAMSAGDYRPRRTLAARGEVGQLAQAMTQMAHQLQERQRVTEAMESLSRQNELVLQSVGDGVFGLDSHGAITFVNAAALRMLGFTRDELFGHPQHELIHHTRPDGTPYPSSECRVCRSLAEAVVYRVDNEVFWRKDGSSFPVEYVAAPMLIHGEVAGTVVTFRDITTRKETETLLRHASSHDALTGLPNRVLLHDCIAGRMDHARRAGDERFAILFVDLDRFKLINDSLGHAAGDSFLVTIAGRLQETVASVRRRFSGQFTTLARLGGDEFVILLDGFEQATDVAAFVDEVERKLRQPCLIGGHGVVPTGSVGIVLYDPRYHSAEEMLRDADTAMYRAKSAGKARSVIFDHAMHQQVEANLALEDDLRRAAERGELCLHYQPIVSLENGNLVGFEALVRWRHPHRGMVSPMEFIPLAEETGLILPIGEWALREACRQLASWRRRFPAFATLAMNVNLSRRQIVLHDDLVSLVRSALTEAQIPPECLHLEITESCIMQDVAAASTVLQNLKGLGVKLALDDFGTGHSSLSSLHRFPIDDLKIDRSFVSHAKSRVGYAAIVQAIIALAHNMNTRVVAEGIEHAEQVAQLQALDCDLAQGYYFSKPMSAEVADRFLGAGNDLTALERGRAISRQASAA